MANTKTSKGFSDEEKAAMRERSAELKSDNGENAVLAKIAAMQGSDKELAKKIHELVKKNAPMLSPKTWYGMPAYANSDGKVVCFFQDARKFKTRYATLGFSDSAKLDEGNIWPVTYAVSKLTEAEEAKIVALIKKAVR